MTEYQATKPRPTAAEASVRILDEDECWRLLSASSLGQFAVRVGGGVDVFPVNYLVHGGEVFFRSAPGSKLVDLTRDPRVAFEIARVARAIEGRQSCVPRTELDTIDAPRAC